MEQKHTALTVLILLFCFGFTFVEGYDPCDDMICHICDRGLNLIWPTDSLALADNALDSLCTDPQLPIDGGSVGAIGHWGSDLLCPDGEKAYAAFDGEVVASDVDPTDLTDGEYNLGRYVILEANYAPADGSVYYALYAHLMKDGVAQVGE
ncbi:MAG: hypothetical protein KKD39_03530, partial [Candidatus Altiarchaeota archaeon]|nr:hypothetical protein [Candidatus Altiarchaeota archaeon]